MNTPLLLQEPKNEAKQDKIPTNKQIQAAKNLVENGGNMGKAILDAGYSPATAKTPSKVFGNATIRELLKNAKLDEVHAFRILKKKIHSKNEKIQIQALDMLFKLNGSYAPKKVEGKHEINTFSLTNLRKQIQEQGIDIIKMRYG